MLTTILSSRGSESLFLRPNFSASVGSTVWKYLSRRRGGGAGPASSASALPFFLSPFSALGPFSAFGALAAFSALGALAPFSGFSASLDFGSLAITVFRYSRAVYFLAGGSCLRLFLFCRRYLAEASAALFAEAFLGAVFQHPRA